MSQPYDDVQAAIMAIRSRIDGPPKPSPADQALLEKDWDRLDTISAQIELDELKIVTDQVAKATADLRKVVDGARTDPLASFIAKITAASQKILLPQSNIVQQNSSLRTVANSTQQFSPTPTDSGPLSYQQQATIKAILNVFETGYVRGDYSNITVIKGDTGGLTYGRSQTTLNAGGLSSLVDDYCADLSRPLAQNLNQYRNRLKSRDPTLNSDVHFHNLLRAAADYQIMRDIQDQFFDRFYWTPAETAARELGLTTALGLAIVYDGFVHGSFNLLRHRTDRKAGTATTVGEGEWLQSYVDEREFWLSSSARSDLRATVYRTQTFRSLISAGLWGLPLPLVIRDNIISADSLAAFPPKVFNGPAPKSRELILGQSIPSGQDVRHVQLRLTAHDIGKKIKADGLYGPSSKQAVLNYQENAGLSSTGIVDTATFIKLGF